MMTLQKMANVTPSSRQIQWQQLEFYGFIHFGLNTFTDKEWGDGTDSPALFQPKNLDVRQWVRSMKAAGMKGAILTAKHHDGFCLWPSQYTDYSVAAAPYQDGQGDIVREFSEACQAESFKFGIYLSPWDRNHPTYGQGKAYNTYFLNQLEELLTQYGDVFEVWFDGACGEGENGQVQTYDWDAYYRLIRRLQPQAAVSVCGPDVRWVGNEGGHSRANEWSVVPKSLQDNEKIAADSQQEADGSTMKLFDSADEDLGSRERLLSYDGELVWYPAELNVSIRPGWFYHSTEDEEVRSLDNLWSIYKQSVGNNCTFLLNIPPTPDGLFADPDVQRLENLGRQINEFYRRNIIDQAKIEWSSEAVSVDMEELRQLSLDGQPWRPSPEDETPNIQLTFAEKQTLHTVILREYIPDGQQIEHVEIRTVIDGQERILAEARSIGYQKFIEFPTVQTDNLTIAIKQYRSTIAISAVGIIADK